VERATVGEASAFVKVSLSGEAFVRGGRGQQRKSTRASFPSKREIREQNARNDFSVVNGNILDQYADSRLARENALPVCAAKRRVAPKYRSRAERAKGIAARWKKERHICSLKITGRFCERSGIGFIGLSKTTERAKIRARTRIPSYKNSRFSLFLSLSLCALLPISRLFSSLLGPAVPFFIKDHVKITDRDR